MIILVIFVSFQYCPSLFILGNRAALQKCYFAKQEEYSGCLKTIVRFGVDNTFVLMCNLMCGFDVRFQGLFFM
jgi:hypothetical protein